jgi:hypothetical protein
MRRIMQKALKSLTRKIRGIRPIRVTLAPRASAVLYELSHEANKIGIK